MNFTDLGEIFKNEREKRGLTIEDAASYLKINARQLRALETGDVKALPPPAYVKGFIRSYASWLGIGSDELQKILSDEEAPANQDAPEHLTLGKTEKKGGHKGFFFFICTLLLAAAAYYAWNNGYLNQIIAMTSPDQHKDGQAQRADAFFAEKDKREAEKNVNLAIKTLPPTQDDASALHPPHAPEVKSPDTKPDSQVDNKSDSERVENVSVGNDSRETAAEKNDSQTDGNSFSGQHKLIITAIEECWIHSNADRTDTRQFSLRKGDTFALTFAKTLELKLGNAGGVRLRYDGVDLPPAGTSGQVKNITFPPGLKNE